MLTIMLAMFAICVQADDYKSLSFTDASGSTTYASATGLEITISDGKLYVVDGIYTYVYTLNTLSQMVFSAEDPAAVESIEAEEETEGRVTAYTTLGRKAGTFDNIEQARANLTGGIYIMKTDKGTSKIVVR